MGNQYENFLTAIDVGSAKTCVLVAEITGNGLRYRGHGVAESRGSRKGVIVDLEKAIGPSRSAVEQAENAAGVPVEHALLGIAGPHIRGVNSQGGISSARVRVKLAAKKFVRPWIKPEQFPCLRTVKFSTCCRRNSFSMTRAASMIRWA